MIVIKDCSEMKYTNASGGINVMEYLSGGTVIGNGFRVVSPIYFYNYYMEGNHWL